MVTTLRPRYGRALPRVTVVIPCYNYGHYLPMAVDSALQQPGVQVDVIIVDDCSTDDSLQVARDLEARDGRIRVIRQNPNRGHIRTYNHGLAEATGDYVVLLSADDLLAPGSLRRSTGLMEAQPSVGLVYGHTPAFESVPEHRRTTRETWSVWPGLEWMSLMAHRGHNIIVNPEAILRKSVMDQLVGYRQDMPQAADMELWLRAASLCDVGRINGPDQAYYRVHSNNMHRTTLQGTAREAQARRDVFLSLNDCRTLPQTVRSDLVRQAMRKMSRDLIHEAREALGTDSQEARELVRELCDMAVSCEPQIRDTLSWRILRLRQWYDFPGIVTLIEDSAYRVLWTYRWRRWRRWGV